MSRRKNVLRQPGKTDLEYAELQGKVKQVNQICYKAYRGSTRIEKGKIDRSTYPSQTFSEWYDEKGMKTEAKLYYNGRWYKHQFWNGNKEPFEEVHVFRGGERTSRVTREYDENGRITSLCYWDDKGKKQHGYFKVYDAKGNMIESTNFTGEVITNKHTICYDDAGRVIESISSTDKIKEIKANFIYDDKGNQTEAIQYNDGVLSHHTTTEYRYDANGIISKSTRHNHARPSAVAARTEFTHNQHGDIIQADHYNEDGSLQESHAFEVKYDKDGKKILPVFNEPKEKPDSQTEECENDAHGNWIKKITYYASPSHKSNKIPVNLFIRDITYWDDEKPGEHDDNLFFKDLSEEKDEYDSNDEKKSPMEELDEEQLKWLSEASQPNDVFPLFRYYALTNNELPSVLNYTGPYIEAEALLYELKENLDARVIFSTNSVWNQGGEKLNRYVLSFPGHPGFLLASGGLSGNDMEEFEIPDFIEESTHCSDSGYVYFCQFQLYRPSEASGKLDEFNDESDFARQIDDYITKCSLKKKPDKPVIHMIEVNNNGFSIEEHAVDDDFEIKDLDVNYGEGFQKFHNELMQRFMTGTKGLVLFHGLPGTGKTYYIRHLLRKMASGKKAVIYMPPNLVDHLVEPAFMTFLSGAVKDWNAEGNFCVLLIEDAEPLLAKRQEGVRIQGVTNLLNMTDGLLNDMLNLQIICTFNVDLRKLDSALLRPGRLIARKEFKALNELDANLLAQRLGIRHHFNKPATLGEIYALRKNSNTLIHDVDPDKNASSQLDDLL
jgi:hypothetical protein